MVKKIASDFAAITWCSWLLHGTGAWQIFTDVSNEQTASTRFLQNIGSYNLPQNAVFNLDLSSAANTGAFFPHKFMN